MPDEPACRFTVSIPPSTNHLFASVAGNNGNAAQRRAKTAFYRQWLTDQGWQIKADAVRPVAGIVRVLIEAPLLRRRDLDNALKPLLDLLVKMQIIADDNLIDDLRIVRAGTGDKCTVSIWPM